ncbi:MAG: hypothetical protein IPP91_12450 [Betaproteobacteria bacterium]|nr:hypothetical protein [Betaproteobacteria bacterium]
MKCIRMILAALASLLLLAGCVVYEPVPVPVDPFEAPWQAATGAINDAGLTLVTADRGTGTIRGTRGAVEGIINVRTRPDGRVGVEISSLDPNKQDPTLTQRLTDSYNRRMGR